MAKELNLAAEGSFASPDATLTTDNANDDLQVKVLANDLIVEDTNGNTTLIWDASESEYRFVDTIDVRSDIESDTQTIWDDSAGEIDQSALANDSVTVAGNAVALGGSTAIALGDLSDADLDGTDLEDQSTGGAGTIYDASAGALLSAALDNDSVTVAGNSVSLGGSTTVAAGDLSDITTSTPSAGDLLIFHGTNSAFENAALTGGDGIDVTNGDASVTVAADLATSAGLKFSSGQLAVEPDDFAGTGLGDDGSDNLAINEEPFAYDPGITEWEDGLTDEEIGRIALQTGETLRVERIEFRQKGGGSSASASIDVRDVTAGSTIGSQDLGGTTKDPGASGTANTIIIRVNNSTGGPIDAAPRVTGWIEGA